MRKIIGIVIVAVLLCTITCGSCEDNSAATPFTATITSSVVPESAIEIIASDDQRAVLTVCLALDFGLCDDGKDYMANNFSSYLINDSYVASDGTFLVVTGYAGGKCLNMFYSPKTGEASYYLTDVDLPDELMDLLVKTSAENLTLSYKNDVADLLKVMNIIKDAIGK